MDRKLTRRVFLTTVAGGGVGLTLDCARRAVEKPTPGKPAAAGPALWKAGRAKIVITPRKPVWQTGYGARTKPSEGTFHELHAKAVALEDRSGRRAVLVTSDLLGFPAVVAKNIADRVRKEYRLRRDRLMLTSTHTHGGPAVASPNGFLYGPRTTVEQQRDIEDYTRELEDKVVAVVGSALRDLRPARLSFGHAQASFALNRRKKTEKGYVIGENPEGPVDHDVPFLRVDSEGGELRAVVFGYACHNTTLGATIYQFHGDYAGFAQGWLETRHPDAMALFVEGCGGDINPHPRGTLELAQQHGDSLAVAVDGAMSGRLQPVGGPLKTAFELLPLPFPTPPSREDLQKQSESKDVYQQWYARHMLRVLERDGRLPASYPCPLQVWQFGRDLTLIAIGGEVVVEYALRLKKAFGDRTWVAGYSNDVFAYVPSRRIVEEGGYEGASAMIYYVQPGPFAPSVEEAIVSKVGEMVAQLRGK